MNSSRRIYSLLCKSLFARPVAQVVLVCLVFSLIVIASIFQKLPWFDEGGLANPAYNLLNYGHLGMPIHLTQLEVWLKTDYYTYYIMPISMVLNAGWFALVGFGLIQMRLLSAIFGLLLIVSLYFGVKRVSGQHGIALLAMVIAGTDYNITVWAADGRMDMMCAGFGFAAFACYLVLREKRLGWAIPSSLALVVASGLTHPNGIFYLIGVGALILYYDRGRLRLIHLALGVLPFVAGAVGWGSYILQDVEVFRSQFFGTASGRTFHLETLLLGIDRYLSVAFGIGPDIELVGRLKILQLVAYWGAVLVYIVYRPLRIESRIGPLVTLLAIMVIVMALVITGPQLIYLIHVIPLYAVILASLIWYAIRHSKISRLAACAVLAGLIAIQAGGPIFKYFVKNDYRTAYLPTVERLKELRKPGDIIVASSEFGFAFGFEGEVIDDFRLGIRQGYTGDIVVVGDSYNKLYKELMANSPEDYDVIADRLATLYEKMDNVAEYDIYILKRPSEPISDTLGR